MGKRNVVPGHQAPAGGRLFAQVRASSIAKYPYLELGRWYPIRRQDRLGCFIEIDGAEGFLKRDHYVGREGRRDADRPAAAMVEPRMTELSR